MPSAVKIARGLFGRGASGAGPTVEDSQPEPSASIAGCGEGWNGPRLGGEGRRHGPPDAARLGPSLQRLGPGGPDRQLDARVPSLVCQRSNWLRWRRSSRLVRIARRTASCAGDGSTSSASSPSGSGSSFTSAMLESCSRRSASPTSAQGRAIRRKTRGSSRLSKKLPARAEGSS